SKHGSKLYVTVGSNSNHAENGIDKEQGRPANWELDAATRNHRIFATGIPKPNAMEWDPKPAKIWTAYNERDKNGTEMFPESLTTVQNA
ncbi:sorbosone dehydrogenase family protein, partial [Pseudomonas syringae pv. tagetis]